MILSCNVTTSVIRIRYRMFSDSDEGGGDRSWSELRHDLLAVEERTSGWLPDIQLATLMRTNMQVMSEDLTFNISKYL